MKRLATLALYTAACTALLFAQSHAQTAGCDIMLVSASDDSVVVKAEFYTPVQAQIRIEAIYVALGYDPAVFYTTDLRGIKNHLFAAAGFQSDSDPTLDTNGVAPDISLYGESHPTFSSIPYAGNTRARLCTFTFFPKSPGGGTTSLTILGNRVAAAMSGYYIPSETDNQPFTPANDLIDFFYPVELSLFTAVQQGRAVELRWVTASETGNHGFHVERRPAGASDDAWSALDFVKGRGTTRQDAHYLFIDQSLPTDGVYEYRLRQVDFDGAETFSPVARVEFRTSDAAFELAQNYPNPISATGGRPTAFRFSLPERSFVRFTITNMLGRTVADLATYSLDAGTYTETWNPSGLPSGVYIATLTAEGETSKLARTASVRVQVVR